MNDFSSSHLGIIDIRSDNNVNQVTQQLLTLGHEKKDKPAPLTPRRCLKTPPPPEPKVEDDEDQQEATKNIPSPEEIAQSKMLGQLPGSLGLDKCFEIQLFFTDIAELRTLFPDEDDVVIQLALESTDFDFDKAKIILTNTLKQDETGPSTKTVTFS